jgi:hypothetical protein
MGLSPDGIGIILTLAAAFITHVFWFGRLLGKFETDLRRLGEAFNAFRDQHFLPREEYEARHRELVEVVTRLIRESRETR